MQKKHIIWDFNGTLLNDAQLSVDCDNHVFDELGLARITIEDYRAHMTMPVRDFYTALGVDLNVYKYETISRIWLDRFNRHAVSVGLVPGALELTKRMKEAGFTAIRVFADRRFEAPAEGEQRIYIKARKGRIL